MPADVPLGAAGSSIAWVQLRGVAPTGPLTERQLAGGVSSSVVAVEGPVDGVVVKRALERLRVQGDWRSDPHRSLSEAKALETLGAITPGRVPRLLDVDPRTCTLVLERAPSGATDWRTLLLGGPADPQVGDDLGATLAAWQRATWTPWPGAGDFAAGSTIFEELRLRPFHGRVAECFPLLSAQIDALADELRSARRCLVHGDLSPKNVLLGDGLMWVIDAEVAHMGDPVFDVAFMGCHLILVAIARPRSLASVGATWFAFLDRYTSEAPTSDLSSRLAAHVGALLLARTDGLSPEPGLDAPQVERARQLGRHMLLRPPAAPDLWGDVRHALT